MKWCVVGDESLIVKDACDMCNVSATVNHSLAFSVSYNIARNAFSNDASAGENSFYTCIATVCEKFVIISKFL